MCGIGGLIAVHDRGEFLPRLQAMATAMAHRGPDDEGLTCIEGSGLRGGLVARRLAIQDCSPLGHQPMVSTQTANQLCLNGEIYNVKELRNQLEAIGYRFRGSSDTEVLLAAYDEWGLACLERLRGMFAFAVWDAAQQSIFLARDRLGIKPLYYSVGSTRLLFASEIRALLATGLVDSRFSLPGLGSYLTWGAVHEPLTMIEGVFALPPAHYATWHPGRLSLQRYWSLSDRATEATTGLSRQAAVVHLRGLLEEAVKLELISDVPLGAFLSGGVDSSAIVALMKRVSGEAPRTVSVVFPEHEHSEAQYIQAVSKKHGTQHTDVMLSDADLLRELPRALDAMDQPTFDGINTFVVSKAAKAAGLTVVHSGLGGDELFGGYSSFRWIPMLNSINTVTPVFLRRAISPSVSLLLGDNDRSHKLSRSLADAQNISGIYDVTRELFSPNDTLKLVPGLADLHQLSDGVTSFSPRDAVNTVSLLELTSYMPNVLLHDADIMSMAHGLEVRVPLLDFRLVEFVAALPGRFKYPFPRAKSLLLDAIGKDIPDEVSHRKKLGFTFPFDLWLRGPLKREIEATLLDQSCGGQLSGAFHPPTIRGIWERFLDGKSHWTMPWSIYVLKNWGERHLS